MGTRWENDEFFYTPNHLVSLLGAADDIVLPVSSLPVSLRELAAAGWTCKVRHNRYGGRTHISFRGPDNRSVITFRIAGKYRGYAITELLRLISVPGVMTSVSQAIKTLPTDEELLNQVHANITTRLKAKPRKRKAPVLEKMLAFAAGA